VLIIALSRFLSFFFDISLSDTISVFCRREEREELFSCVFLLFFLLFVILSLDLTLCSFSSIILRSFLGFNLVYLAFFLWTQSC